MDVVLQNQTSLSLLEPGQCFRWRGEHYMVGDTRIVIRLTDGRVYAEWVDRLVTKVRVEAHVFERCENR